MRMLVKIPFHVSVCELTGGDVENSLRSGHRTREIRSSHGLFDERSDPTELPVMVDADNVMHIHRAALLVETPRPRLHDGAIVGPQVSEPEPPPNRVPDSEQGGASQHTCGRI